jgi:hypothetical protein
MPIVEAQDPRTRRWLLYPNAAQHTADYVANPYEKRPTRVFLDTNVVNVLVRHADQVFEHSPVPSGTDRTRAEDVEALMHVFHVGARASWDLVTSQKTVDEVSATPEHADRQDLVHYAQELLQPSNRDRNLAEDFGRRLVGTRFVSALPDIADQMLIGIAIGYGCDAFCTCDRKTIVRYRDRLPDLPLRILTPLEWWRCIKPWAGLFV